MAVTNIEVRNTVVGSVKFESAILTVTGTRQSEFVGTIFDSNVNPTSKILIQHGSYTTTDVNEDEAESIKSIEVKSISTGSFKIRIVAMGSIFGDFKFNYLLF